MLFHQFVSLRTLHVFAHHLGNQLVKTDFRCPAQLGFCLACIAEQGFDFGRAEVARIDRDDAFAASIITLFFDTLALPGDCHAQFFGCRIQEVSHAVLHASGDDEVLGVVLLQHHRDEAAIGDAHDVGPPDAQLVEQVGHGPGLLVQGGGKTDGRAVAEPQQVGHDQGVGRRQVVQLLVPGGQAVATEAVQQQQGRALILIF